MPGGVRCAAAPATSAVGQAGFVASASATPALSPMRWAQKVKSRGSASAREAALTKCSAGWPNSALCARLEIAESASAASTASNSTRSSAPSTALPSQIASFCAGAALPERTCSRSSALMASSVSGRRGSASGAVWSGLLGRHVRWSGRGRSACGGMIEAGAPEPECPIPGCPRIRRPPAAGVPRGARDKTCNRTRRLERAAPARRSGTALQETVSNRAVFPREGARHRSSLLSRSRTRRSALLHRDRESAPQSG